MADQKVPRIGVAVLVSDPEGRLLLGKRGKQSNFGKWVIPGGGIRFGEDWITAGTRELLEETGLIVEIFPGQRPLVWQIFDKEEHRIVLFVQGTAVGGWLRPASDLLDVRFFAKDAIPRGDISPAIEPVLVEFGW